MEGVYATLALVGAVTGYGFTKAKKQSFQKYVMSSQEIETTKQSGQELDALANASPNKNGAYDYLLRKLPEFVRTKATKTLESINQSKRTGAPPSVAYSNIRLALLTDRELGNITANQELFFPKREVFYKWFREGLAAPPPPPGPVTPESMRQPRARSESEFTDRSRSESQFTDRSDSVPPSLMNLETKREILRRMGITDRASFGQWADLRRQTNPQRVAEVEAYVNEVFPVQTVPVPQPREEGWGGEATPTPQPSAPAPAPAPIRIPQPAPQPSAPAPQPSAPAPIQIPAPAPAPATVPLPEPGAGLGFEAQPETPAATPVETPGPLPTTTVPAPAPAPDQEEARAFLQSQTPPITDMNSFIEWARQNEGRNPQPVYEAFLRGYPDIPIAFPTQPQPTTVIPSPRGPQSMTSRWRTQRARRNLFGRQTPAPAPLEFEQVNPMLAPAPQPTIPPPTREQPNEEARAALFGRQPPAPAVARPSLLSRLRRVTLRAPRGATKKQKDAKAELDQLAITNVEEFSTYIQGKSSTEQMNALQNGVIAYPDDADLFLDAMTADETAGTAFAQSSDALKKSIQKAADKARKKRPAALVTAPAAISAMMATPAPAPEGTTPEEIAALTVGPPAPAPQPAPTKVSEIRPATTVGPSYAPVGIPPHMRGLLTPLPSGVVRETPAPLTVPAPPPPLLQPTDSEREAQLNDFIASTAAGTGLGLVAPPPLPEPQGEVATPLPVSTAPALARQQGTRQLTPRKARTRSEARKTAIARLKQAGIAVHPMGLSPEEEAVFREADEAIAQGQAALRPSPEPQDELDAILNAPTPTPTPASQASAATASSGEVWTPETAEPPASVPAPPPGPPPVAAPVPPIGLNTTEAKAWLKDNLGIESETDFRRWMRENTSIVTEPILTTAENAFPTATIRGLGNFRTYYTVLRGNQTRTVGTRRRGGRKVRKNTLRRRPKVNTKNVRRISHRKNRAKRTHTNSR